MAIDEPDDFGALRRRVAVLEAMLETILDTDLRWSRLDDDFSPGRKFSKDRLRRLPEDLYYLIDQYRHRSDREFLLIIDDIKEIRTAQTVTARELAQLTRIMQRG